jgi:hypothetical protein
VTDDGPPYILGKDFFLGDRVVYRSFQCARCGADCMTSTTEADANREFLGSGINDGSEIRSLCDDCYEYVMTRARADGLLNEK